MSANDDMGVYIPEKNIQKFTVISTCTHCGANIEANCREGMTKCEFCGATYRVKDGCVLAEDNPLIKKIDTDSQQTVSERETNYSNRIEEELNKKAEEEEKEYQRQIQVEMMEKNKKVRETDKKIYSSLGCFFQSILYFFGFALCFPIPIMVILKKFEKLEKAWKVAIITIAWTIYICLFINGRTI